MKPRTSLRYSALLAGLLTSTAAIAADNATLITPCASSCVTMRSRDIGAGVQSMIQILGDNAGAPIYGTAGVSNAAVLSVQGIASGTALPISGTLTGVTTVSTVTAVTSVTNPVTVAGQAATGAALAGNPVRIGLSDGTNAQNWLTANAQADGVTGNNTAAVAAWVWNGASYDRMPGTTAGVTVRSPVAANFLATATQSGTWTVQPGNTANTTAWLVTGTGGTFPVTAAASAFTAGSLGSGAILDLGTQGDSACATDNGSCTEISLIKRANQRLTTIIAGIPVTATLVAATGVRVTGNAGGIFDGATGAAVPANALQVAFAQGGNLVAATGTSGNLNVQCANCSGSGVSTADAATFTATTSLFAGSGGFFQTTATNNALTTGQQGMFQVTANRALFTNLRNAAGAEVGVTGAELFVGGRGTAGTPAGGVLTIQGVASMTKLLVTPDSVALPANQSVNISQINAVTPLMGNGVTGTGSQRVTIASDNTAFSVNATLSAETTKVIGTVRNVGNVGGVFDAATAAAVPANALQMGMAQGGNLIALTGTSGNLNVQCANCSGSGVSTVDAATFTATTSLFAGGGGFFQTTATNNALTNGQQGMWQMTANRAGFVNLRNAAGAEVGVTGAELFVGGRGTAGTPAGGVLTIQGVASMTKLLVTPDSVALPANQSVNVSQINGVTTLMGNGATGTGSQRVTIANDNTLPTGWASSVAIASTTSGQTGPLAQCAVTTAAPTYTTAQTDPLSCDTGGSLRTTVTNTNANGQATMANSSPVVIASNQSAVPVTLTSTTVTGSVAVTAASGAFASGSIASGAIASGAVASGAFASGSVSSGAYASGSLASGAMVDITNVSTPITPATATATKGLLVGGQYNSTQATFTNGQQGSIQISSRGEVKTNICDAAANARCVNVDANNNAGVVLAAETTKVIGTVNLAASQTLATVTNLAQMNGAALLMGNGVTGTGSQRVTIASDNTAFSVNATLSAETTKVIGTVRNVGNAGAAFDAATGAAPPANAVYVGANTSGATGGLVQGLIQCDSKAIYDASTNGSTELVALTSGRTVHVCGYSIMASGTVNVKLIYGTGTACATGATNMTPAWQLTAQVGLVDGSPFARGLKTASANALCINTSAGVSTQAIVYYAVI